MSERVTEFRLKTLYEGEHNRVAELDVEWFAKGKWRRLELDTLSGGFLLFNYGLCSCQHLYFRTNAAESGLILHSSIGHLKTVADENWLIHSVDVSFDGVLHSGEVEQSKIDYIIERMGHCPVTTNMKDSVQRAVRVSIA